MNEDDSFVDKEDQPTLGGFTSHEELLDARPHFIKEENIKDMQGKRPDDPDYDFKTLYIPAKEWANFTPAMK